MLDKLDLTRSMKSKEWNKLQPALQLKLYDLEKAVFDAGLPAIVLFEGWDASGKGSTIRALTQRLDPRGFKVWPIRAARTYEKGYPWLWRFWLKLPNHGQIAIFDRSWYGRVLVERVEGLIAEQDWRTAYRDIVDFERMLSDDGYVLVKFWLHISKQEQRRRFKKLEKDPLESWHVQPEDWEHHRKYGEYLQAVEEMLERTETEWAPWTIVEATDQEYTFWKVFTTVIDALSESLRARGVDPERLGAAAAQAGTAEPAPLAQGEAGEAAGLPAEAAVATGPA